MMLTRSQFNQDFEQIKAEVKHVYHTYVQAFVTYPEIDELSLHFTYLFLTSLQCSRDERQTYCVSQALIQLGLDSHDEVGIEPAQGDFSLKQRQLTVLSGDLFSGYYYFYLSQKSELQLISQWSKVIQEINIQKTDLHLNYNQCSQEEIAQQRNELSKSLTNAVFSWFQASPFWFDTFALATELRNTARHDADHPSVKALTSKYQDNLYQCAEDWLREELALWLNLNVVTLK